MLVILRRNTFPTFPDNFLDRQGRPKMPFRVYYEEIWTPWLQEGYSSRTTPFLLGPESLYAKALDPAMLSCTENVRQQAMKLARDYRRLLNEALINDYCKDWRKLSL